MKRKIKFLLLSVGLLTMGFKVLSNHDSCTASISHGKLYFMECQPNDKFIVVGSVNAYGCFGINHKYSRYRDYMIDKAKEKGIDFDAIIINDGEGIKADLIKFQ